MKHTFVLVGISLFSSILALASQPAYDLKLHVTDGKTSSHSEMVVLRGKTATYEAEESSDGVRRFVDVVANESQPGMPIPDAIWLKLVIGTINAAGQRTIVGSPELVVVDRHEATISQTPNGGDVWSVSVTATRKQI